MMRRAIALIALVVLGACGASARGAARSAQANADRVLAIARLENQVQEQSGRIAELEARLALLEQETRETRGAAQKPMQTVRIGSGSQASHAGAAAGASSAESNLKVVPLPGDHAENAPVRAAAAGRDVIAAEGREVPASGRDTPAEARDAPAAGRDALAAGDALAEGRDARAAGRDMSAASGPVVSGSPGRDASSAVRDQYRAALRLVREGRWEDALLAWSRFLAQYPHDDLSDNARYWRGEAQYALRRYDEALNDFQGVLARFPASDKAADSLLKIGMCHLRRGDRVQAQRYFEQVIEQYPKSDAARIASKEGSS